MMPFGLHGVSATLQRLVDKVLCGVSDFALAYLHDIVIYSNTWEEHLKSLQIVSECLRSAGPSINAPNCSFVKAETEHRGHFISMGLIKPQI